jgi:hypothetical protein
MSDIPLLGWAAIVLVAGITVFMFVVLAALLRSRNQAGELRDRIKKRPPNTTMRIINEMQETLRDPFRSEREQLDQLSRLVESLNNQETREENPPSPNAEEKIKRPYTPAFISSWFNQKMVFYFHY